MKIKELNEEENNEKGVYSKRTWDEITDSCVYVDEAYDELGNMWSLYKDVKRGVYLLSPYNGKLKDVSIEKE